MWAFDHFISEAAYQAVRNGVGPASVALTLEDLGNIGEIVGSVGVVASLLYLAMQVHQNTKAERTRAVYSYMQSYGDAIRSVTTSTETSRIFRVGGEDPSALDDDERHLYFYQVGQFMTNWEGLFSLYENGTLGEPRWGAVRADMSSVLTTRGGRSYWTEARQSFDSYPELQRLIDQIVAADSAKWSATMRHST